MKNCKRLSMKLSVRKTHKNVLIICLALLGSFFDTHAALASQKYSSLHRRSVSKRDSTWNSTWNSTSDISSFERECYQEINKIRLTSGLPPLKEWGELAKCARNHSQNMAYGKCNFGHDGFHKRAKEMQKIATLLSFGENVAYSHGHEDKDLIKIATLGWMKSQGHRENILGDFNETGIGVAISKEGKFYVTQLFSKKI